MRNIAFSVVATVITSPVANAWETLQAPRGTCEQAHSRHQLP